MEYYGVIYTSEEHTYISIVEGIYYVRDVPMARMIGCINITDNTMIKYVKQPYIVINKTDTELTLKQRDFDIEENKINHHKIYSIIDILLIECEISSPNIQHMKQKISEISGNRSIKTQSSALGEWVSL